METRKFINDTKEKIRKDLDSLPEYFSARAGKFYYYYYYYYCAAAADPYTSLLFDRRGREGHTKGVHRREGL